MDSITRRDKGLVYISDELVMEDQGKGVLQMGMFVNPGNDAFQVALNSEIYVDKTGLLQYTNRLMNTLQGYICNSRPRRFGKSVTANMPGSVYWFYGRRSPQFMPKI